MNISRPIFLRRFRGRVGVSAGGGGGTAATFVSKRVYNLTAPAGTDASIPIPLSAATGDLLAIQMIEGSGNSNATLTANGSTAAFTMGSGPDVVPAASSFVYLFWRQLSAADISTGTLTATHGTTGDALMMSLYRGATNLTVKDFQQPGGPTVAFSSFTPSGSQLGVGASFIQTGTPGTVTITSAGWTQREGGPSGDAFFGVSSLDLLSTSAGGGAFSFSGFPATGAVAGYLFELT